MGFVGVGVSVGANDGAFRRGLRPRTPDVEEPARTDDERIGAVAVFADLHRPESFDRGPMPRPVTLLAPGGAGRSPAYRPVAIQDMFDRSAIPAVRVGCPEKVVLIGLPQVLHRLGDALGELKVLLPGWAERVKHSPGERESYFFRVFRPDFSHSSNAS